MSTLTVKKPREVTIRLVAILILLFLTAMVVATGPFADAAVGWGAVVFLVLMLVFSNKKDYRPMLTFVGFAVGVMGIVNGTKHIQQGLTPSGRGSGEIQRAVNKSSSEFLIYEDLDHVAKLKYPANWQREDKVAGHLVEFKMFAGSVNVHFAIDDLARLATLDEYTEFMRATTKKAWKQLEQEGFHNALLQEGHTTLAGRSGGMWRYSISGKTDAMATAIWIVNEKKAYTLAYTATRDLYEPFLPIFKQMVESLQIVR